LPGALIPSLSYCGPKPLWKAPIIAIFGTI
jgi:hypothetical protein